MLIGLSDLVKERKLSKIVINRDKSKIIEHLLLYLTWSYKDHTLLSFKTRGATVLFWM